MPNCREAEVSVRAAASEDLGAVKRILEGSALQIWSQNSLRSYLEDRRISFRVLTRRGLRVGFSLSRILLDEMELLVLAVACEWRGRGYGRRLLLDALEQGRRRGARTCFLEVREGNKAALGLYFRNGFELDRVREGYYREVQEDAWVLRRPIEASGGFRDGDKRAGGG